MTSAFFDLETTGIGKHRGSSFVNPVGIYSVGFGVGNKKPTELFGKTAQKFENDALQMTSKSNLDKLGTAVMNEHEMLSHFVSNLQREGVTKLIGYNSHSFDTPLLIKRLRHLGLKQEADYVRGLEHVDLMKMVKSNMDQALSPYKESILWEFGEVGHMPRGMSLEAVAAGLGINTGMAHEAGADVAMSQKVYALANNPKEFLKRFQPTRWAKAVDRIALTKAKRRAKETVDVIDYNAAIPDEIMLDSTKQPSMYGSIVGGSQGQRGAFVKPEGASIKGDVLDNITSDWSAPPKDVAAEAERVAAKKGITIAEAAAEIKARSGVAKEKALDAAIGGLDSIANRLDKFSLAGIGGVVAAGVLGGAWLLSKEGKEESLADDMMISASALGLPEGEVRQLISRSGSIKQFNRDISKKATLGALKAGRVVHKQVEAELSELDNFVGSEVEVVDRYLGVKGFADTVLRAGGQDVPVELKTVDDSMIKQMTGPNSAHAAQANFYAHALGASESYVMYISRENPDNRVSFRVAYDPGSLLADVQKFRTAAFMSAPTKGWAKPLETFFGNRSGIRDQINRNAFFGTPRTANQENNTYVGSRHLPR